MQHEPDRLPERLGLPEPAKAVALAALALDGGFVIWSFHSHEWLGFGACLTASVFLAVIAGGLVGVRLLPSLMMLTLMCGLNEGLYQGWQRHGLIGAAVCGLIGAGVGMVLATLSAMSAHLILLARGITPPVESNGEAHEVQPRAGDSEDRTA